MSGPRLSALVVVHNEETQLRDCLSRLTFADELVVVLDKCTDGSKAISQEFNAKLLEGDWEIEGSRRNAGIAQCTGDWVLEIDADERVSPDLAGEIRDKIAVTSFDWHEIRVENYIGGRAVRWGWGASYGKASYAGLFRRGIKSWGKQRVHPSLSWREGARKGGKLENRLDHYVDNDISDMIQRLDRYSSARAQDLRESGQIGSFANNLRRFFTRFFKCYVRRKGYREGYYGFLIALFAGLYPLLSHIKARVEER